MAGTEIIFFKKELCIVFSKLCIYVCMLQRSEDTYECQKKSAVLT